MPATAQPTAPFADLKAWLEGTGFDKLAGSLPEDINDGGKPATTGEHAAGNVALVKKVVPGQNVEEGKDNPKDHDKNYTHSDLEQGTVGTMPDVEKAVKTVTEENDKIEKLATAGLNNDANFEAAVAALEKMAAELPVLITAMGVPTPVQIFDNKTPAGQTPAGSKAAVAASQSAPQLKSAADVVEGYRKWGADRGAMTAQYLLGFQTQYNLLTKMADDGTLDPALAGGAPPDAGMAPADAMPPGAQPPESAPQGPPPGGDAGGAEGGAPSLDDVAAALAEMGLTADDLMQIAQKMKGDVEAGPAPAHEKEAAVNVLDGISKTASEVKNHVSGGKFRFKPAADGSPERKRRDAARQYIDELRTAGGR